ncbi:MAG TPA: fused MFS/spermidine synthase [Aromatoleum sp.]|uniref:fused MFS/spermidine synthase n=1 Tax=Aromatoleum sp. TaxID=2307007 RepID=UPI002B45D659|nr:fused MFS/spermidine synthase [Aromatoleum sp.]HJV27821.1 fused MFS/spermidine synthase [Aromatoleum sp.]
MSTPIDISEDGGVRYLHFGSEWIQGAMRIRRPYALELAYTREMMAGLLLHDSDEWPRTALVIGLGAASLTRFIHRHCPQTHMQVVEIEPRVVAAARQFFKLPDEDERLAIHVGDGVRYVMETNRKFDLILVDGFDRNARAGGLDTAPFYAAARSCLSDRGLMSVNLFGRSRGFRASVERIVTTFEDRAIAFPSCDSGNVVALAAQGDRIELPLAELRDRAHKLKELTELDLRQTVTRLEQAGSLPGGRLIL